MYISKEELLQIWHNLIYAPKQLSNFILDLTINSIRTFVGQGQLDFGGSEYQSAALKIIDPKLEDDPKYGFWTLKQGDYLVSYNEIIINSDYTVLVFPHPRLLNAGTTHPSFLWQPTEEENKITTILQVGNMGIKLKENARISRAITQKLSMNDG